MDDIEFRIQEGYLLCGDPDEVLEQARRYEAVGCDQLVFGLPVNMSWAAAEETIRLFGEHVIPKLDPDATHRTTAFRNAASKG
jgi:alkanesulfonate monooxygenase SsuD/methylene tetrahydromethanopterin reductase-like flavin-dependent oxidoreductase (luciferase family)